MEAVVRTFVALRCAPRIQDRLRARAEALKAGDRALRLPAASDLHLTLHFLGDTLREDLPAIGRALQEVGGRASPVAVRYRGLGAFPNRSRPRVVWAGLEEEDPGTALLDLARAVGTALEGLGYPPERRRFHPHVTLARVRGRPTAGVLERLEAASDVALGSEILSELKLILSDPGQRPYHYIDLTTVELGG